MHMIKDFLQTKKECPLSQDKVVVIKRQRQPLRMMDHPELSLGPSLSSTFSSNSFSLESEAYPSRKRKYTCDELSTQTSIELHLNDPLPLDWEQCLDLKSGRMYYLNRKTLKRSWSRPKGEKLDLDLNISTPLSSELKADPVAREDPMRQNNSSGNMVAMACANCHLLVMLCKSFPSCPNCKYVHCLPSKQQAPRRKIVAAKPLETLSLLN